MLKRDEEFIVAWRGSRVPSCARSKVKCACVLLHKAVYYVRAAHEAWKFCVTVLSSSTDFIFSTVSYYRQFCWSSRKQQSAFVNRMQYRSRVVESITLVWKKNGAFLCVTKQILTVCQVEICAPSVLPFVSPRPLFRFSFFLTSPSYRFHAPSLCRCSATRGQVSRVLYTVQTHTHSHTAYLHGQY